jgi:hypothetical protein
MLGNPRWHQGYKLNFMELRQHWLRRTAKQYLKMCLSTIVCASAQVDQSSPGITPTAISPTVITDSTIHLARLNLAPSTRHKIICNAKLYFDACYQNEVLGVQILRA